MTNTRRIGSTYEDLACAFLENCGYRILRRNYRTRFGEIDIIARQNTAEQESTGVPYTVFIEVKYRRGAGAGSPLEAVDYRKQRQISRTALHFLMEEHLGTDLPVRFDVIGIDGERNIRHVENAFSYVF